MVHKDSDRKGEQLTCRIWAHHLHIQLCQLHQRTSRVIAAVKPFGQGSMHKDRNYDNILLEYIGII